MSTKSEDKKPQGRPTKYQEKYDQMLIDHMSEGGTFQAFILKLDAPVNFDTLYNWLEIHPTFSESYKIAKNCQRAYYDELTRKSLELVDGKMNINNGLHKFIYATQFGVSENPAQTLKKKNYDSLEGAHQAYRNGEISIQELEIEIRLYETQAKVAQERALFDAGIKDQLDYERRFGK